MVAFEKFNYDPIAGKIISTVDFGKPQHIEWL